MELEGKLATSQPKGSSRRKAFTQATMYRVASFVVMEHWRKERAMVSLNGAIPAEDGDDVELRGRY